MASGWSIRRTCAWSLPLFLVVAVLSHIPWLYHRLYLGPAAPLAGMLRPRINLGLLAAAVLAAAVVRWGAVVAERLAWGTLLVLSSLTAMAWAAVLALNDGFSVLAGHIAAPYQVWNDLPSLQRLGVHRFLRLYVRDLPHYAVHSQGHPPGAILVMDGFHQLGLSTAGATATLDIITGGSAVAAVAVVLELLVGELVARRTLPFLVLAPTAIWVATTMDALFMGVCAWAIALVALAVRWSGLRRLLATAGSTLLCACALMLSYGLLPLGLLMVVVLVGGRRQVVTAACVAAGTVVLLALVGLTGFSWLSGFSATHHAYVTTVASVRPYLYFLVADLVVLSVMVGPAVLGGLRVLDRQLWPLVGGAVVVLLFLDLSGYTKGEVERIWLPFALWLLPAAASLPLPRHRSWLTAQAVTALVIQAFLVSLW
jgi:hypothetical protein